MYDIQHTDDEINETMNRADVAAKDGSKVPGMAYEQGVVDALRWLFGDVQEGPLDDAMFELEGD